MIDFAIHQSDIEGRGVYANRVFHRGEVIFTLVGRQVSGKEIDELLEAGDLNMDDPLQIDVDTYLLLEPDSRTFNHSCDPNMGVRGESELFALRDIAVGEELTYDYSTVVGSVNGAWSMECNCGSPKCRSRISTWESLPVDVRARYLKVGAFPDFILDEISS